MTVTEKIKWLNRGITLGKWRAKVENCQNLTEVPVGEGSRIYCGTEDYVEFFETIISTLGLSIDYQVEMVDGEYEIVIGG